MRGAYVANLELIVPSSVFKTEAGSALQQRLWVSCISAFSCDEHDLNSANIQQDETWHILTKVDSRVAGVSEIFQQDARRVISLM